MATIYPKYIGAPQLVHLKPVAESGNLHLVQCSSLPSLRVVPLVANATLALGMTLYFDIYGIVTGGELAFGVGYAGETFDQEIVNFGDVYASNVVGYDGDSIDYTLTWQPYLDHSRLTMVLSTTVSPGSLDGAYLGVNVWNASGTFAKGFTNVAF